MGRRHGRFRRIRNRRVGEHAERSTRRPSGYQPQPRRTAVSPFPRHIRLAARHQRDVGGTHRRLLRLPGVVVDPPAKPTLAADRRDRSLLRRRAGPARQLGDFRRLRSTGRALPTVVAVLQRVSATRADSVIPRRLRELLRADRARSSLDHRRFIEPQISDSWLGRHRLVAVFVTGFVAGLPFNAVMQFMWLKVGLFVYTEAAGPCYTCSAETCRFTW